MWQQALTDAGITPTGEVEAALERTFNHFHQIAKYFHELPAEEQAFYMQAAVAAGIANRGDVVAEIKTFAESILLAPTTVDRAATTIYAIIEAGLKSEKLAELTPERRAAMAAYLPVRLRAEIQTLINGGLPEAVATAHGYGLEVYLGVMVHLTYGYLKIFRSQFLKFIMSNDWAAIEAAMAG